ncbi:MAG: LytR C-terminal domain-containing protein [Patescibacteria group bacterium]|jgi:hypothetical protein
MSSLKLTLNHIIVFVFALVGLALLLISFRVAAETIQTAIGVDKNMAISTATQLNRQSLGKALSLINKRVPEQAVVENVPKENYEEQATSSAAKLSIPKKVEIVNASGKTGGAKQVSSLFSGDTEVELVTSQSLLDETTIFYKNEYRQWEKPLKDRLLELGWGEIKEEILQTEDKFDIRVILGVEGE